MSYFKGDVALYMLTKMRYGEKASGSEIAMRCKISYSHLHKLIYEAKKRGLVSIGKDGRNLQVSLTQKGNNVSLLLMQLDHLLKGGRK